MDSTKMEVITDPLASGGITLRVKDTFGNIIPTTPVAEAMYSLNVNDPGDYYIWIRLMAFDAGSDSIFTNVGSEGFDTVVPGPYNQYLWFKVKNHQTGNYIHSLSAGSTTINLGHREW